MYKLIDDLEFITKKAMKVAKHIDIRAFEDYMMYKSKCAPCIQEIALDYDKYVTCMVEQWNNALEYVITKYG